MKKVVESRKHGIVTNDTKNRKHGRGGKLGIRVQLMQLAFVIKKRRFVERTAPRQHDWRWFVLLGSVAGPQGAA